MPLKIFIGNNPLFLCSTGFILPSNEAFDLSGKDLIQEDFISSKKLLELIEKLENKKQLMACVLYHKNEEELIKEFFSNFNLINAAGGLVENTNSEILMIYRKGKWDLPKGKVEHKEMLIAAAEREVIEETGIKNLSVLNQILFYPWKQNATIHTYWENNKRIVKNTYWYKMKSTIGSDFIPQLEEGITEVKWVNKSSVSDLLKKSYASITDVLRYGKF